MIKAILLTALAAGAAAHKGKKKGNDVPEPEPVMATCNRTCLSVAVTDFYGDGWDSVEFHGEKEGGESFSLAPDCVNRRVERQICPDEDGTYYFTAVHANSSYTPENYWEVFWTATSHNCDGSVANVYTGGFNSSLIVDYTDTKWTAQYWENLWDNEKQCDACGDAAMCKPKKPKGKGGRGHGKGKGGNGKGGGGKKPGSGADKPIDGAGGDGDGSNSTKVPKAKPRYGPPAVNLRVTMFDEAGDGWWMNDYSGASWYLADDRREKLFNTGTLCDGSVGSCNMCLGDGSYTMRFTGEASNFTAWDFCGVTGQRATELTFHVLKGKCYADSVVSLRTECTGSVSTEVTLTGVVAISGFSSEIVSEGSFSALANTLAAMVNGWSAENIRIVSTALDTVAPSSRRLSDFTQDFTFETTFIAEQDFGVDGRSYSNLENLAKNLYTTLNYKMSSGLFESTLHADMLLSGLQLSESSTAELISLQVGTVHFQGVEEVAESTLPEVDYSSYSESVSVSSYNVQAIAVFFGVALAGFVAFVGIMRTAVAASESYDSLSEDSEQAAYVSESEMETSSSPMVKSAFAIDATPTTSLKL